jgi:hypothetical protein
LPATAFTQLAQTQRLRESDPMVIEEWQAASAA